MRGRWELSDAQWKLIEAILCPNDVPTVVVGHGRTLGPHSMAFCGCWEQEPTGANCLINIRQTCHRRLQQRVREGKLERILRVLAKELQARGKLPLEEAFIDAAFAGAKKGASRLGQPSAAKGRKSSLSPMITVFLSPLVSKALRRMKPTRRRRPRA